ncbi:MAG: HD domain-containing protein [Desulfobacteraceae bacterium]|nr:MAG: HD domain-containing protein [Desulfobacteraceae bacterium]
MQRIAEFVFEALFLKQIPRSGYQFLGAGRESVAEHVYAATMIAFILSRLEPKAHTERLICMTLLHDLPEARIGDLNYVQKHYVASDEVSATEDALRDLPFGFQIKALLEEFNAAESLEAQLARDADQMALMVDLKLLNDLGYQTPQQWLPHVEKRLRTQAARDLAKALLNTPRDEWWLRLFY